MGDGSAEGLAAKRQRYMPTYHSKCILLLVAADRQYLRVVVERHGRDGCRQVHQLAQRLGRYWQQPNVLVVTRLRGNLGRLVNIDDASGRAVRCQL